MNRLKSMHRVFLLAVLVCSTRVSHAQQPTLNAAVSGDRKVDVTVGMSGYIKQVVLPGPELVAKEVDPRRTPIALRIDDIFPHGDELRYDLTFIAFEPGSHDLRDFLQRKDGSSVADLPPLRVTVNSVLPAEQLAPSAPTNDQFARFGGYRIVMGLAIFVWILGLFAILLVGRKKKPTAAFSHANESRRQVDAIRLMIQNAMDSEDLSTDQKAELDMKILNFWRDRRQLQDVAVSDALTQLKSDDQAGPLLNGLERWFYSKDIPAKSEMNSLLQPMADLTAHSDPVDLPPEGATS